MENTYSQFKDKVALVTGATSGIGEATALAFARSGANVVVTGVQQEEGESLVKRIRDEGGDALFVKVDVTNQTDVDNMMAEVSNAYGRLDYAYNNAGIEGETAATAESSDENWNRVLDINLTGVWRCMRAELPLLLASGGGAIVNCASVAGVMGFAGTGPYVASKHGVIGLTKAAALEYAARNIRVNAVCPGVIATPMVDRVTQHNEAAVQQLSSVAPLGRMGTAEEIAAAVLWLCSDASGFVVGHALVLDGGWTVG